VLKYNFIEAVKEQEQGVERNPPFHFSGSQTEFVNQKKL
jgi:hypothetical protein